ncbi:MAG: aldehyde dehydrogenase family protein [Campylobacterales bacterium]
MEQAVVWFGSTPIETGGWREVRNPYDGSVVSRVAVCDEALAAKVLAHAACAAESARKVPLSRRILWMEDVAQRLLEAKEEFARTITAEVGKPIALARIEVDRAIETLRLSAMAAANLTGHTIPTDIMPSGRQTMSFYRREPVGVVVAITPFNFPLNLVMHKVAPALATGNAVVLKPAPEAPLTAYKIAKLFIESPYATADALSVLYGDAEVGSVLVTSDIPRVISFTGSVPVGRIIMKSAGIKKVSLELGGNAATFIDATADLDHAAKRCAIGAFSNSGQVCISLQRIYVHEGVYEAFAARLAQESLNLKVGSPWDEETFIGPLINDEAAARAMRWIQSAVSEGARVAVGGHAEGVMMVPTVMVDVRDDMAIVCEEVFAPIVSLVKVGSFDEALEKINNSPYGLQYSIFTNDLKLAMRAVEEYRCGGVVVNDIPTLRFDVQPYGGVKESGVGREGPLFACEEFTEIKSVIFC